MLLDGSASGYYYTFGLMKFMFMVFFSLVSLSSSAFFPPPFALVEKNNSSKPLDGIDSTTMHAVPEEFREQAYIALSYYPELKGKKIKFKYKNQKTTMACMPRLDFLFRKRENRTYVISIDKKLKNNEGILLGDVPFDAQVGVIGHEIGHVVDYEGKSILGIISTGFRYLFSSYRRKLENHIDEITIGRGLGNQLAEYADYVFHRSQASPKYLNYKRKFYYQPEEIQSLMAKMVLMHSISN